MLVQKLQGGLGNQMFQYAFIKALSLRNKSNFCLDISEYQTYFRPYELEIFAIDKKYAETTQIPYYENIQLQHKIFSFLWTKIRGFLKNLNPNHHIEKNMNWDQSFMTFSKGYFEGYFQSEKYFADVEGAIRSDFSFLLPLSEKSQHLAEKIKDQITVSVHIRRGDYLQGNNLNYHGICGMDYYQNAIEYLQKKEKNLTFVFFSDDIERVKENFAMGSAYFVDRNVGKDAWQDMQLMSLCKHNIIANSSFSWRGAWLNANPEKIVIAPKHWFANPELTDQDIVPESWIRL